MDVVLLNCVQCESISGSSIPNLLPSISFSVPAKNICHPSESYRRREKNACLSLTIAFSLDILVCSRFRIFIYIPANIPFSLIVFIH